MRATWLCAWMCMRAAACWCDVARRAIIGEEVRKERVWWKWLVAERGVLLGLLSQLVRVVVRGGLVHWARAAALEGRSAQRAHLGIWL